MGQDNYTYVLLLALQDNTDRKPKPKVIITESWKAENTSSPLALPSK